jgi:hypothetical protein
MGTSNYAYLVIISISEEPDPSTLETVGPFKALVSVYQNVWCQFAEAVLS